MTFAVTPLIAPQEEQVKTFQEEYKLTSTAVKPWRAHECNNGGELGGFQPKMKSHKHAGNLPKKVAGSGDLT